MEDDGGEGCVATTNVLPPLPICVSVPYRPVPFCKIVDCCPNSPNEPLTRATVDGFWLLK